ncbi:MAG: GNAT family N-acetyltransferase [Fimbriimonadaceae bacterium]|nr:GNAT family N-acetyltransferase [Fimbriimonadaceae bacterium]
MEVPEDRPRYLETRIETARTTLRPWEPERDAEDAFAIYSDPLVAEFLSGSVEESLDEQLEKLQASVRAYSQLEGGYGPYAIELKETGTVVGCGLLKPLPRSEDLDAWRAFRDGGPPPEIHEIEVGWHLARTYWGQGLATEAGAALLCHGFHTLRLQEVFAVLYRANRRSASVAKRLGMEHLGPTERFYGVETELYRTTGFPA